MEPEVRRHLNSLTKPVRSLGALEEIALRLSLIRREIKPVLGKKIVFVLAADHGVSGEGVSAYPREVTREMVFNFIRGGAAINVFGRQTGTEVLVVDAGVDFDFAGSEAASSPLFLDKKIGRGTRDFSKEPAMTAQGAKRCLEAGFELAEEAKKRGAGIIALGDMGIGNTTVAAAVGAAAGLPLKGLIDIGTVVDAATLKRKYRLVRDALRLHRPDKSDALDILQKVGGFCMGQMAGVMLRAASRRVPVVLDGFPVSAAALLASLIDPAVREYLFAGHRSAVKGHALVLERLGLSPVLDLGMRLGEGTGAVLSLTIIEAASRMACEMASFDSAGVSKGHEAMLCCVRCWPHSRCSPAFPWGASCRGRMIFAGAWRTFRLSGIVRSVFSWAHRSSGNCSAPIPSSPPLPRLVRSITSSISSTSTASSTRLME